MVNSRQFMKRFLATGFLAFAAPLAAFSNENIPGGSADPDFEGNTGVIVINGLTITKRQDLDFGRIAPNISSFGTVKVNRGSNNNSVCESTLVCLKSGNRARFKIIGQPDQIVTISDPGSIIIYDGQGNNMTVDTFVGAGSGNDTEWRGWQQLRTSGISRFNVGATLTVKPNQPPGTYVGTFTITVNYQ